MGNPLSHSDSRFTKLERLKKKKAIDLLFGKGKKYSLYPLLLFYYPYRDIHDSNHQVLISVPKKHFKKAVVRNSIRRRIRESFRINKHLLYNTSSRFPFLIGYVYISKNVLSYNEINDRVTESLKYLEKQIIIENEVAEN